MNKNIERRLATAAQRLRSKHTEISVIHVEGGFCAGPIRCASAEGSHWQRLPDERQDLFEARVVAAAKVLRARTVVFGLCDCAWKDEANFEA